MVAHCVEKEKVDVDETPITNLGKGGDIHSKMYAGSPPRVSQGSKKKCVLPLVDVNIPFCQSDTALEGFRSDVDRRTGR